MKAVILLLALAACTFALTSEPEYQKAFAEWMQTFKRSYNHDVFRFRYQAFKKNYDFVMVHNSANKTYTVGLNKFADLSSDEFARFYLGTRAQVSAPVIPYVESSALPTSFNWVQKGAVTHVKNQGQCGSCWSFSTTGSVEGCHYLATNNLVSLSEQNLVDCSTAQGNQGCDGGLMTQAMDYIISNNGIDTEASYPYTAEDGTCVYKAANSGSTLGKYTNVISGNEADLQNKVSTGPTSVAIDASHSSFQLYQTGVYNEPDCSTSQLDHGVLAVGWGVSSGANYWMVKNSWGTDWGMQGYIWMTRGSNQCGIATMATIPQQCH